MMRFFFGVDRLRVLSFHAQKRGETDQRSPFFFGKARWALCSGRDGMAGYGWGDREMAGWRFLRFILHEPILCAR